LILGPLLVVGFIDEVLGAGRRPGRNGASPAQFPTRYSDFDDFWQSYSVPEGPSGQPLRKMSPSEIEQNQPQHRISQNRSWRALIAAAPRRGRFLLQKEAKLVRILNRVYCVSGQCDTRQFPIAAPFEEKRQRFLHMYVI
jgi:hypothetical protein